MQCLQCQHENVSDAKFCSQCGTPCAPKLKYLFGVDDALLGTHFAWGGLLFYFGEPVAAHTHLVSPWPYSLSLWDIECHQAWDNGWATAASHPLSPWLRQSRQQYPC